MLLIKNKELLIPNKYSYKNTNNNKKNNNNNNNNKKHNKNTRANQLGCGAQIKTLIIITIRINIIITISLITLSSDNSQTSF